MVRRPAALLGAYLGALALFGVEPALPAVGGHGDLNTIVSDAPALVLLAGCVLALLPAREDVPALALLALGAGLLAAAMVEAHSIPLANVTRALFAGALGLLLARLLAEPIVVVAVPLFVAGLDIASVSGGPADLISRNGSRAGDFLFLYLPAWGGGRAGVIGFADLVFIAFFASCAWRFGLRRRTTAVALVLALPATLTYQVLTGGTIPLLVPLAAALLLVNLDLLPRLLRAQTAG